METSLIREAAGHFAFGLLCALVVLYLAKRAGYFFLPRKVYTPNLSTRRMALLFFGYLVIVFLLIPALHLLLATWVKAHLIPAAWGIWIHLFSLWGLFVFIALYCFVFDRKSGMPFFWPQEGPKGKKMAAALLMGAVSWVVSYPVVIVMSKLTGLISLLLGYSDQVDQVAVKQLAMTQDRPLLFAGMVGLVVVMVPFMEELFFRGLLQNLLKRYLGRFWGIGVTAFLFAATHYVSSQGVGNIQLIASLFVLALFLGFIYEREESLWAPFALHTLFNGSNVALMLIAPHG